VCKERCREELLKAGKENNMNLKWFSHALLLSLLMLASCAGNHKGVGVITESTALELAKAEFVQTGRQLTDYKETIESDGERNRWIVWFDYKYPIPGGKHLVTVDKETGAARFMAGE
jgi:hypothetical protein